MLFETLIEEDALNVFKGSKVWKAPHHECMDVVEVPSFLMCVRCALNLRFYKSADSGGVTQ